MIKKLYKGLRFWFNPFKALYVKGLGGHGGTPPVEPDFLLTEAGGDLLQENGYKIVLD